MKVIEENTRDIIEISKTALKQRGAGYVFYNIDYLKKHFVRESKLIMGEEYVPISVIEKIKAEIKAKCVAYDKGYTIQEADFEDILNTIDQAIKECDTHDNT